ncbi:MAG: hypothetical protein AAF456_25735, partial [Planctomycetota bacterium]
MNFVDTGVLVDIKNLLPGLTTIGCFVQTAITTFFPERALSRNVNGVRVIGMNQDFADVLTVFETDFFRTVVLWEVASGRKVRRLEGHADEVHAVVFHPNGTTLASA